MARSRRSGSERSHVAVWRGLPSRLSAILVVVSSLRPAPLGTSVAAEVTVERARAAARAEIAEGRYQRALPIPENVEESTRRAPASGADRPVFRPRMPAPESMGDAARLVLWVLIAVGGVLLVVFIVNEVARFRRRRPDAHDGRPDGAAADDDAEADGRSAPGGSLHDAELLAREGAYGRAIHVILLALLDAPHGSIGRRMARSLTGREIVGAARLAPRPGAALSRIVAAAERSHFGGYYSSRTDYETCRQDYAAVAADIGDRV